MALTKIPASLLDTASGLDLQGNITLGDNEQIQLGDSSDLQIYHNGTNSFIKDTSANLVLNSDSLLASNAANSQNMIVASGGGAVTLFYAGATKLATSSAGATVTGTLTVTGDLDITGNINSYNVTDLDVTDQTITLGAGQTEANSGGSGIIVDGSNASILWDETNDEWDFNKGINILDGLSVENGKLTINEFTSPSAFTQIRKTNTGSNLAIVSQESIYMLLDENNDQTNRAFFIEHGAGSPGTGTTVFKVEESGNVGIGTDNPQARLHVSAVAPTYTNTSTVFYGGTTNNGVMNGVSLFSSGNALSGGISSNLLFDNGTVSQTNTDRSSGSISFGNTTVASKTSNITFGGYVKGSTTFVERMRIDGDGNVGIGTDDPATELHIASGSPILTLQDTDNTEPLATYIDFLDSAGNEHGWIGYGSGSLDTMQIANAYDDILFFTGTGGSASEKMRITSSGSVGIGTGTSSPLTKLHIGTAGRPFTSTVDKSNGDMVGLVLTANTNQNTMNGIWFSSGADHTGTHWSGIAGSRSDYANTWGTHLSFFTHVDALSNITQATEKMRITSNGNVGIGNTSPLQKLSVNGVINSDSNNDYYGAWLQGDTATNGYSYAAVGDWYSSALYFQKKSGQNFTHIYNYNANYPIVIAAGSSTHGETTGGSNVGIGTTSPTSKLHVDAGTFAGYAVDLVQGGSGGGNHGLRVVSGSGSSYTAIFRANASTVFYVDGAGNYYFSGSNQSDINKKENIADITDSALDLITQLQPKTYNFIGSDIDKAGFIAQDMEQVIPRLVTGNEFDPELTDEDGNNPTGKGIDYMGYTAYLTKAIQELKTELDAAKARITELEG